MARAIRTRFGAGGARAAAAAPAPAAQRAVPPAVPGRPRSRAPGATPTALQRRPEASLATACRRLARWTDP
eukprot:11555368-Alexandrium_andersonii.AAC.1